MIKIRAHDEFNVYSHFIENYFEKIMVHNNRY